MVGTGRVIREGMIVRAKFMNEVTALGLPLGPAPHAASGLVTQADLELLPEPARRYLRFMGVVGVRRDWSFRLAFTGRFRRTPGEPWMKCEAWQYNSRLAVARVFYIRLRFGGLVPVLGRDTYAQGHGRMLIKLLDLFTIADGIDEEYDIGELVTYLNDAALIAPSMLLVPECSCSHVDGNSFDLSLTDHGRTVTARVFVDERGAPVDFSTTDRFYADPKHYKQLERTRWTTPIEGWQEVGGRPVPTRAQAIWHLPAGPFPYADFTLVPGAVAFNVRPGTAGGHRRILSHKRCASEVQDCAPAERRGLQYLCARSTRLLVPGCHRARGA